MQQDTPTQTQSKTWGPVAAVVVTIGTYFAAQIAGGILVTLIALGLKGNETSAQSWLTGSIAGQFLFIFTVEALSVASVYSFLKSRGLTLRAVGLIKKPRWLDAGYVFVGFGLYMVLNQVVTRLVEVGAPNLDQSQKQSIGFDNAHGSSLVLVFISLVILPPIVEEIMTRGFLYSGLKTKLPKVIAALLTSILFATAHLELGSGSAPVWSAALDTFTLSLILVYLYEKTGRLWASIGLHMLKNFVAFLYLFVFLR
jgi:membrane protease YdiL (CAAX protease family)